MVAQRAPVIAEMRDPASVSVVEALGGSAVYAVHPSAVVVNIISLCVLRPPIGRMLAELVSFASDCDFQIAEPPPRPHGTGRSGWCM